MAVRGLLHYALEVPDQTVGEKFYTGFGLVGEGRGDAAVHLRPAPYLQGVLGHLGPAVPQRALQGGRDGGRHLGGEDLVEAPPQEERGRHQQVRDVARVVVQVAAVAVLQEHQVGEGAQDRAGAGLAPAQGVLGLLVLGDVHVHADQVLAKAVQN